MDFGQVSKDEGVFGMAEISVEIEGSVDEVVQVLWQLGSAGHRATVGHAGMSRETPATGARAAAAGEGSSGGWTEALN